MFQSYQFIEYIPETNEHLYKIIDDDFVDTAAATHDDRSVAASTSVIKVYSKRNFSIDDIGLNFALFTRHYQNNYRDYYSLNEVVKWQDNYITRYNPSILNYQEIAQARNKYLQIYKTDYEKRLEHAMKYL